MSRPYCLICKVSTKRTDTIYNIEVNHTKCTDTLLRDFLNTILNYAIKYSTLNVCSSCYGMVNELDILQNKADEAKKKLLSYFSTDLEFQKDRSKKEENSNASVKDEPDDDIEELLNFDDDTETDKSFELDGHAEDDGLGGPLSDDDPEVVLDEKAKLNSKNKKLSEQKKKKKESHECTECKEKFRNKSGLKAHILEAHGIARPYICEICGQRYRNKSGFDVHVGMHNGINPFTCQHCNKTFTQKGSLQRHLHMHTGETPFQCDLCGKRFIHHSSFKVHQLHHTGQKAHKCPICDLALMTGSHLRRHMRVHTGEKRYTCEHCGKKFAERYNYAVHQKVHEKHGVPPQKADCNEKPAEEDPEESLTGTLIEIQQQSDLYQHNDFSVTPIYSAPVVMVPPMAQTVMQPVMPPKMNNCFTNMPVASTPRVITPSLPMWNYST